MKAINKVLLVVSMIAISWGSMAQEPVVKPSNNKVSLNGKPYYIHIVRKGETLFAISLAYEVPVDTIKADNLHAKDTLKVNQYLKIRIQDPDKMETPEFMYHRVKKGDTPFNLAKRYQVTIDGIYELNPDAKLGIKLGETLKIPLPQKKEKAPDLVEEEKKKDTLPKGFIVHKVSRRETKFGISKQYNVTVQELEQANPELLTRQLQNNELIRVPVKKEEIANNEEYHYHKVEPKETIWRISQNYHLSEKDLKKSNPELKRRELQAGELLQIPRTAYTDSVFSSTTVNDTLPVEQDTVVHEIPLPDSVLLAQCASGYDTVNKYKVAFFLPFYLNINDTIGKFEEKIVVDENGNKMVDIVRREGKIEDKIYPRSQIFIEFYEGALLAINELKAKGLSFEIHVFDTQKDSTVVEQLLKGNQLSDFNLFIGPVFGENLQLVGDYAWEHNINIVSPLSLKNGFVDHNPYAFQVSPPFNVQMVHASDFLNNFDIKNYIVIHDGNNLNQEYIANFKKQLYAQMNENNLDQIKYNEVFYYDARDSVLKEVFTPGIENIVIVPSSNQAFVSDVIGKLNGYSYTYDITTFGQPRWIRFDNIELDSYHNTNTHIFSNSFIDYQDSNVIRFVKDYRFHFKGEPDKYAFQGYDVTLYFLTALNKYGHDFRKCIHQHQANLLQTTFKFVPVSDQGGYNNTAIYILQYSDDYKLKKIATYPK